MAGTEVLLGDGQTQEAIEDVRVGRRVATDGGAANSEDGQAVADDPNETRVNPESWRLVTITTADGDWQVQTLVQVAWIEENHVVSGRPIRLSDVVDVAEMGVDDSLYGTVVSVEACPAIEDGPGRVVLTTVSHSNDFVFDLTLTDASGQDDVLGVTGWHKIYSESRGWVSTSELQIGEVVRGANGVVTATGLERRPGRFTVYNMTVERDHVYYVGDLSALVHNNKCSYLWPGEGRVGFEKGGKILFDEIEERAATHATLAAKLDPGSFFYSARISFWLRSAPTRRLSHGGVSVDGSQADH